jgi:hypothetical protein
MASAHPVLTARWSAQCGCLDIITSIGERVSIERHPPLHTAPSGACVDWRLKQEPSLPASLTDAWQMPDGEIIALMRESDRSVISRFKQVPDSSLTNISLWSGGAGWLRQQPLFLHDAAISPGGHALVATQSLPGASVLGLGRFKVRSLNFHWATMPRNVGYLSVADDGCTWACLAECEKSSPWLRLCCRGHSYDLMKSLTSHTSETERGLTWLCHQVMDAHGRNILALDDKGAAWLFKFDPAKPDIRPQAHALEVHAIACALSPCASSAALLLPDNAVRLFNLEGGRLMPITTLLLRSRPSFIAIAHNHELVAGGQGWVIAVEF